MIKAKVSSDYKDIERIFAGGSIQKEILKVWSTEADAYAFEAWKILEMEGPLPLTFNANGEPLMDYRIYGNTEQTGTPTPENPIMPIGCGERVDIIGLSEPLCGTDAYTDSLDLSTGILTRRIKKLVLTGEEHWNLFEGDDNLQFYTNNIISGLPISSSVSNIAEYGATVYTRQQYDYGVYLVSSGYCVAFQMRGSKDTFVNVGTWKAYLAAQYAAGTPVTVWYVLAEPEVTTISVPSGLIGVIEGYLIQDGTPTPDMPIYPTANGEKQTDDTYSIPYGYKLPILSNSTVTSIYLGEVETTRRIKKLVLTGDDELWSYNATYNVFSTIAPNLKTLGLRKTPLFCTHYIVIDDGRRISEVPNNTMYTDQVTNIYIKTDAYTSVTDFKAFIAAQYAAGTPVTVWYVLAETETGIVNEPLMKIGDYADTIDSTQAAVQIPTSKGTTILDYYGEDHFITSDGYELVDKNQNGFILLGSTLRPSKMYIKYKGR